MIPIIILFGTLTFLAGLLLLVNPEIVFGVLRKNQARIELQIMAVAIRMILGLFLIIQADASKYPFAIAIIGWLSVGAAAILAVIGHGNFCRLMDWALSRAKALSRAGGLIASAFGAFLVHAFL